MTLSAQSSTLATLAAVLALGCALSACVEDFPAPPSRRAPQLDPDATVIAPDMATPEQCNGRDDDGDGNIDEGFPVGGPCAQGLGECAVEGAFQCTAAGDRICSAIPGIATRETCNGLDDDCDGATDEEFADDLGQPCSAGGGLCVNEGMIVCGPNGQPTCSAVPGTGVAELCNGRDDDCDGFTDEIFPDLGTACTAGLGACAVPGAIVCDADGMSSICDAAPRNPSREACNGLDDDCDEGVDEERVCGEYVEDHCTVWLGWAQFNPPEGNSPTWGDCPAETSSVQANLACTSSAAGPGIQYLTLPDYYEMNWDDVLSFAFTCSDDDEPTVAQWVQSRCAVYVGHTQAPNAPEPDAQWGECPDALASPPPESCTSSAHDGRFHALRFQDLVDDDDHFAVAFSCRDGDEADRAANVTAAVRVRLAWAQSDQAAADLESEGCPSEGASFACTDSGGDGLFHALSIGAAVSFDPEGEPDRFGISLGAR